MSHLILLLAQLWHLQRASGFQEEKRVTSCMFEGPPHLLGHAQLGVIIFWHEGFSNEIGWTHVLE